MYVFNVIRSPACDVRFVDGKKVVGTRPGLKRVSRKIFSIEEDALSVVPLTFLHDYTERQKGWNKMARFCTMGEMEIDVAIHGC